jgi:hypothetical protein
MTLKVSCTDCGAPYGSDGWCDVVIPDAAWNQIAPEGGVLCFRCMTKRIEAYGLVHVPAIIASGPYRDANEEWRIIGWNHGYKVGVEEGRKSVGDAQ